MATGTLAGNICRHVFLDCGEAPSISGNSYFSGHVARHVNICLALVLSTFPIESASLMILLLIVGYIIQVPTLAFFAQHYGKKLAAMT